MSSDLYPSQPVFLVDDEPSWTNVFRLVLKRNLGVSNVEVFNDSRNVLDAAVNNPPALFLLDMTMPYLTGDQLLEQIKEQMPHVPVIMLTGRTELELAIRCMKLGAYDYFIKTEEDERILGGIRRALELFELHEQNRQLKRRVLSDKLQHPDAFSGLLTSCRKMLSLFNYIEAIAKSPEPVLIVGESGVGKELLAQAVHQTSCPDRPWVAVNVAGLDDNAFSDTLFGHIRGAFTGADRMREGLIEKARGGVIFLDEIGDLQPESQVKLLRFIQEGEYYPLGSDQPKKADVRLVFATNHDLQAKQEEGSFRKDLYYRLRAHQVLVPPLRERPDDIPLLLAHYLEEASAQFDKKVPRLQSSVVDALKRYQFPGNIRELRALLFDAVGTCKTGELSLNDFDLELSHLAGGNNNISAEPAENPAHVIYPDNLPTLKEGAALLVGEALQRAGGNRAVAAKLLGISQAALSKRLKNMRENHNEN
jgi:DNA-binding NtrC family response regulator